jgi:hypothetical protein
MKPLAIVLSGVGGGGEGDGGGDLSSVQWKPIQNCHNESLLYHGYILMKKFKKQSVSCRT